MIKHKQAKGLIRRYMLLFGFKGFTSLWNTIYYMDEPSKVSKYLRAHELKHIEQMERYNRIKFISKTIFLVKYTYYLIRYSYHKNPYEIEARAVDYEQEGETI